MHETLGRAVPGPERGLRPRWIGGIAAVTGLVAILTMSGPAGAAASWSIVSSPDATGVANDFIQDVACASSTRCMAVGYTMSSSNVDQTLIESWNGKKWTIVTSPDTAVSDILSGISCVASSACIAVGRSLNASNTGSTLIESWNGKKWRIVTSPNHGKNGSILNAVSCAAVGSCTAVGEFYNSSGDTLSLAESSNGGHWSIASSPNSSTSLNYLNGVSCTSPTSCVAVGTYDDGAMAGWTLTETWDGISWTVVPSADVGSDGQTNTLQSVSCSSATSCTAVGSYTANNLGSQTLIESWDGMTWSVASSPNDGSNPNYLYGVSCTSATDCTAVGTYDVGTTFSGTLIESWDGESWTTASSPDQGSESTLFGVSCISAGGCTAVGLYHTASEDNQTLFESEA